MLTDPSTRVGKRGLRWVENIDLTVIGIATVVAGVQEISLMIEHRSVQLADLLLLFIYLEVLTMVGLYLESGQLPVRMPLYIGMVALARYLAGQICSNANALNYRACRARGVGRVSVSVTRHFQAPASGYAMRLLTRPTSFS